MTITPSANDISTSRYAIPLFLALIVAGLAGNYFPFSILNAHFIFGSIFAMLALQLFGFGWGVVAAAIISGYTYLAWNHPWAIVTMTAEVAVVGLLIRTRKVHLVIADTLYWLLIGIPLGYLCFHVIANFPVSNTMFLMTKQAMNGIANALVARLIFTGYSFRSKALLISFRENMSNLLVFFVLCTALAMLTADSKTDFTKTDHQIRASLNWDSQDMTDCLENWVKERSLPIANLARMAETLSPTQMQLRLEQAKASDINFLRIALIDKEGAAVAYSPLADELGRNNIGKNFADRPYIPALKQTLKPMLSQVIVSRFGRPDPIAIMLAPVVSRGGYEGAVGGILNFDRIQSVLKTTSTNQDTLYTLLDKNDNVFITNRKDQQVMAPFLRGKGTLKRLDEGTSQWIPTLPPNTSTIELWGKSFYVAESTIGDLAKWKLILEQPVAPFQKKLYDHYTGRFYMLFIFLLVSLALAEFLSRLIVKTTEQLSQITRDLPAKVASDSAIVWPESTIVETNHLIGNFKEMADSLKAKFIESRQINESLEQKVRERTEALRESEDRYRSLVEIQTDLICRFIPDGTFVYVNDAYCRFFEKTKDELIGKKWQPLPINQDVTFIQEKLQTLSPSNPTVLIENSILSGKGDIHWMQFLNTGLFDHDGKLMEIQSVGRDITERKQAEENLRLSKAQLELAAVATNIGHWDWNLDTNEVYFSPLWKSQFGYEDHEIPNRFEEWETRLHPDDHSRVMKAIMDYIEGRSPEYDLEFRLRHKDGTYRWIYTRANGQSDKDGRPYRLFGCHIDVTERKLMDDRLRESENRFRDIAHSMADWIWEVDKDGKYTYVSDTVKNTLGYSSKELIGKTPFDLMPDGERVKIKEIFLEIVSRSGPIVDLENWNLAKDGKEVCFLTNGVPIIDADSELQGYRGVDKDITNQKKLEAEKITIEAQLQHSQKMEAVGTLAGGIAHDFNNILAIILGNAELASDDVPDGNPATENLEEIRLASIRAKDMVQQLLSFSRKTDKKSKPLNMVPIIKESMKMLRSAIPTSVEFRQTLSDNPCNIMGDAAQLNQIVMNLVTNAAAAMSEKGGLLEVTLEKIILQEEKGCFDWVLSPGAYVRLRMMDTGEGIEPKIMDRIFEPYYTTKEVGKGTGMGLSVIHGIVKRYGGGIRVESALGKGTLFEIYFPALKEMAEEEKEPEGEIKGGSERILFVDDEESMVNLNRQRLERLGYQVKSTTKPVEALEWFKANPDQFDAIITDMTMPRMTGDKLAAEILKIRPHMPVIICTGYSERMSAKKAAALGVRKYIEKPIELRKLASSIREVLDEK